MFRNCTRFNQNLSRWNISNVEGDIELIFVGSLINEQNKPRLVPDQLGGRRKKYLKSMRRKSTKIGKRKSNRKTKRKTRKNKSKKLVNKKRK